MHTLRIALDANEANVAQRVGSNIYAYNLLCQLERLTRQSDKFSFTVFLSSPPQSDFPLKRPGFTIKVIGPKKLWTQIRFPLELFLHPKSYDLVLSLGHYAPRLSPVPTMICIMDLAFLHFPQFFSKRDLLQLTAWTKYSAKNAHHIITISNNSKKDIQNAYEIEASKISIVYPGARFPDKLGSREHDIKYLKDFALVPQEYLVSIGTIQPRKNMLNLIKAFEKLPSKYKLVFVGKPGWLTDEFEKALRASPARSRIVTTGFVSQEAKFALLRQAVCSVLVGFYEGFGIPVIESMGVGVLPVVANTGSLPEVVSNLGVIVDPYSISDIQRGLQEAVERKLASSEASHLISRAKEFTWEKSGKDLLDVIESKGVK